MDAVCINQDDYRERSEQVAQMPSIYGKAWQVVIWLGLDLHFDMQVLMRRSEYVRRFENLLSGTLQRSDIMRSISQQKIRNLLQRPWFYRVWVQQERSLAQRKTVICGKVSMPWNVFVDSVGQVIDAWSLDTTLPPSFKSQPIGGAEEALGVLSRMRGYCATDPRDHLFAARGMMANPEVVTVDYSRSVSETFVDFARRYVDMTKNLNILSHCQGVTSERSWAPDWSVPSKCETIAQSDELSRCYHAGPVPPPYGPLFYMSEEATKCPVLSMGAVYLGPVAWVSSHILSHEELESETQWSQDWASRSSRTDAALVRLLNNDWTYFDYRPPRGDFAVQERISSLRRPSSVDEKESMSTSMQKYCTSLYRNWFGHAESNSRVRSKHYHPKKPGLTWKAGKPPQEQPGVAGEVLDLLLADLAVSYSCKTFAKTSSEGSEAAAIAQEAAQVEVQAIEKAVDQITKIGRKRKLFVSAQGTFGLATADVRLEDELYIMPGTVTPFMLREHDRHPPPLSDLRLKHKLVGECFVNRLMGDQPWKHDANLPGGIDLRDDLQAKGYRIQYAHLY